MRRHFLTAALVAVSITACGGDSTAPDPIAAVAGSYTLTQVNGATPPVTVFQNTAGRIEYISGTMTLRTDGSYTETSTLRTIYNSGAAPQVNSLNENGTFTVVGSTLTFSVPPSGGDSGFSYTGAVSGGALTYTYEGMARRYQKN